MEKIPRSAPESEMDGEILKTITIYNMHPGQLAHKKAVKRF
jgi:hypothetical protein